MTKPRLRYGNGLWWIRCQAGAWGVGATAAEAYLRWERVVQSMREKAKRDAAGIQRVAA